jgi:sugar lactone lactonase YvrE
MLGDDDPIIIPGLDPMTGFEAHAYSEGAYLTWNSMLGSTSVVIRRSTSSYPAGPSDGVGVYTGFGQHHFDTGLTMGQTYYYTAFAYNSSSDYSSAVHGSITMAPLTPKGWIGGGSDGWHTGSAPTSGTDYRWMAGPASVGVDRYENVYVVERDNHRVSKWDKDGNALGWIGGGIDGWQQTAAPSSGNDLRSFSSPEGIFVERNGTMFVADTGNHRVVKWASDATAVGWIGGGSNGWHTGASAGPGTDANTFSSPTGVTVDWLDRVFVADRDNHRIAYWSSVGDAIGWMGGGTSGWQTTAAPAAGSDSSSFDTPYDVTIDGSTLYIADTGNHRIAKWSLSASSQGWLGSGAGTWQTGSVCTPGSDAASFQTPRGVAFDELGNLYIADTGNHRLTKWEADGTPLGWATSSGWETTGTYSSAGTGFLSFDSPQGLAVDDDRNLLLADRGNHRVIRWDD